MPILTDRQRLPQAKTENFLRDLSRTFMESSTSDHCEAVATTTGCGESSNICCCCCCCDCCCCCGAFMAAAPWSAKSVRCRQSASSVQFGFRRGHQGREPTDRGKSIQGEGNTSSELEQQQQQSSSRSYSSSNATATASSPVQAQLMQKVLKPGAAIELFKLKFDFTVRVPVPSWVRVSVCVCVRECP